MIKNVPARLPQSVPYPWHAPTQSRANQIFKRAWVNRLQQPCLCTRLSTHAKKPGTVVAIHHDKKNKSKRCVQAIYFKTDAGSRSPYIHGYRITHKSHMCQCACPAAAVCHTHTWIRRKARNSKCNARTSRMEIDGNAT